MARVILSEYAAKRLLVGDDYAGISVDDIATLSDISLPAGMYVVKVDTGIKKRNQKGLVVLGLDTERALAQARTFLNEGHHRVLIEPMFAHNEIAEQYLSCTLNRSGVSVLYAKAGGNTVERNDEVVKKTISRKDFLEGVGVSDEEVPFGVVSMLLSAMRKYHICFIEINPFVVAGEEVTFLDAAMEVDSSKLHTLPVWVERHVQNTSQHSAAEIEIKKLDEQSTSSFSLTVFDKDAAVFTLLSGGGASLVVLDSFVDAGLQSLVANYGEYSGAPTREETQYYTESLLKLLFASTAPRKVLVIAGGVANFTDITTTFSGIIDACENYLEEFKRQSVMVVVRRGGPRQAEGLRSLKAFFETQGILATVSDPGMALPQIAIEAGQFIKNTP